MPRGDCPGVTAYGPYPSTGPSTTPTGEPCGIVSPASPDPPPRRVSRAGTPVLAAEVDGRATGVHRMGRPSGGIYPWSQPTRHRPKARRAVDPVPGGPARLAPQPWSSLVVPRP